MYSITWHGSRKELRSPRYNYTFDLSTGFFARWGEDESDDPAFSPFGPEILDIEITTQCGGIDGRVCPFCYKSNLPVGRHMSFDMFKAILDKMPPTLTQVAFGADATGQANPDIWRMMDYCRDRGVVPNITVSQITPEIADKLATRCGAVSVSRYDNPDVCYDAVKMLTDRGLTQCNIHAMVSMETYDRTIETLNDTLWDSRLAKLNAIVLLSLKPFGRGAAYHRVPQELFDDIVAFALANNIRFGCDSCSAAKLMAAIKDEKLRAEIASSVEPCESFGLFSAYVDVYGFYYPCSFCPGTRDWEHGQSVLACRSFVDEIWNGAKIAAFRNKSIMCGRECLLTTI
jgi:hypothetical protein